MADGALPTSPPDYGPMLAAAREYFDSGASRRIANRKAALTRLAKWIETNDAEITGALYRDLHKAPLESWGTELGVVMDEIRHNLKHLDEWAAPRKTSVNVKVAPAKAVVYPEPYGVALIMAPWNYPFMLSIDPLVAAITAGNCVVLKPSNYAPHTAAVIEKLCNEVFEPGHVSVVHGGRVENAALLDQDFDTIFFTGSPAVGRIVQEAAAKHLTPVTLELGGKSPCIVDETAAIWESAKRIVWGKFLNAGQTCVAPDYILAHASIADELVAALEHWIKEFYADPRTGHYLANPDYPHIINDQHYQRLMGLIDQTKVVCGGIGDPNTRAIAPTIMTNVTWDDAVMGEEIFGPILPVLTWSDPREVVRIVNGHPHPLATYIFTTDPARENYFVSRLRFGGGCVNDVVVHVANTDLPFGGLGESGMGAYHGKMGFDTFTHYKSVLHRSLIDVPLRYPPYTPVKLAMIRQVSALNPLKLLASRLPESAGIRTRGPAQFPLDVSTSGDDND